MGLAWANAVNVVEVPGEGALVGAGLVLEPLAEAVPGERLVPQVVRLVLVCHNMPNMLSSLMPTCYPMNW